MANVGFYNTSQEKIEGILKSQKGNNFNNNITEGSFYLTEKNKLYIGRKNASNNILIEPINAGITPVADFNTLQTFSGETGEFYYIESDNILCVRSGNSWVQINAIVTNSHVTHTAAGAVGENSEAIENTITVSTNIYDSRGGNPATGSFNIEGVDGITISGAGSLVTVKGDPITVESNIADNTLTATFKSNSGATDGSFEIVGGSNISFETVEGKTTIKAADNYAEVITVANTTGENATGFDIGATLNSGSTITTGHLDPAIVLKATEESLNTEVKFVNGSAVLPVYTATQVDGIKSDLQAEIIDTIRNFNAMVYRGTVGTTGTLAALPTTEIRVGDAYLVSGTLIIGTENYPAGTLVVATGEEVEGTDYIEDGKVIWTFVTGSTADTRYFGKVNTSTGALGIYASTDSAGAPVAAVNVVAGTTMEVGTSATSNEEGTQTYTINHKTFEGESYDVESNKTVAAKMTATSSEYKIKAITGITVENGHITGVSSTEYNVLDTNVTLSSGMNVTAANNIASVKLTNTLHNKEIGDAAPVEASFNIKSDSLIVTAPDTSNVAINLVWGSF